MERRRKQQRFYQRFSLNLSLCVFGFRPAHLNRWLPRGKLKWLKTRDKKFGSFAKLMLTQL
jgi:hypothetical protein